MNSNYMKQRQRGRGRKPNNNHSGGQGGGGGNRSFESNGPEIKVRGPASHIYEKYVQLARDANSSGDRVLAENFLQHAEHYYRVMRASMPRDRFEDYEQRSESAAQAEEEADAAE